MAGQDNLDLFGRPSDAPALTPLERKRMKRRATEMPRGYVMPPGSGPAGETCRTCAHAAVKPFMSVKKYWGCDLYRAAAGWSRGFRTDIRIKSSACSKWQKKGAR